MEINNRITVNPNVMGGKPCLRGTRITVGNIVGQLSVGRTTRQILDDFPDIEEADIQAALAFAAWRTEEVEIPIEFFASKTC